MLKRWWRQPDRYLWMSNYLAVHHVQAPTRFGAAAVLIGVAAGPLLTLFSPDGPTNPTVRAVFVGVSVIATVFAVLWLLRWPTRRQSLLFGLITTLLAAVVSLLLPNAIWAVMTCTLFTVTAAYMALLHTAGYLLLVFGVALGTAAVRLLEVARQGDPAAAVAAQIMLLVVLLTPTVAGQTLVRALGTDAAESDVDVLTGLRNRRGFYRGSHGLVRALRDDPAARLGVIVIDLDKFKRINDTHGHDFGDRVLIAVGDVIRGALAGSTAIAGRLGGEEFAVAGAYPEREAIALTERLCRAIADLPYGVTVSVGVVNAPLAPVADGQVRSLLTQFVSTADQAMYEAKHAGGDQIRYLPGPESGFSADSL